MESKSLCKIRWYHLMILNTMVFILSSLLLQFSFETDDDIMMCLIANGGIMGTPDCHLVFINALWGTILSFLYTITKTVEWYTISFAIVHILSMTIIGYVLLKRKRTNCFIRIAWLLLFYAFWLRIIVAFQFTTTAALSCIAGCILLVYSVNYKQVIWGGNDLGCIVDQV